MRRRHLVDLRPMTLSLCYDHARARVVDSSERSPRWLKCSARQLLKVGLRPPCLSTSPQRLPRARDLATNHKGSSTFSALSLLIAGQERSSGQLPIRRQTTPQVLPSAPPIFNNLAEWPLPSRARGLASLTSRQSTSASSLLTAIRGKSVG